jgi:hypothetical protein
VAGCYWILAWCYQVYCNTDMGPAWRALTHYASCSAASKEAGVRLFAACVVSGRWVVVASTLVLRCIR